ncbi:MAG: hypothetical protein ABII74_07345 [Elusimicrobiota bacterium]
MMRSKFAKYMVTVVLFCLLSGVKNSEAKVVVMANLITLVEWQLIDLGMFMWLIPEIVEFKSLYIELLLRANNVE